VPAGKVVTIADVIRESFGVQGVAGTIEISSDPPVYASARVTAETASGGRHGFASPAIRANSTAVPGGPAVFIQASDTGPAGMESELQVTNPTDGPTEVTVKAFDADGVAGGQPLTLSLGPKEVVRIPAAFSSIAGSGAAFGRLEIAPTQGSQPVFAFLVRRDGKTGDADGIFPYFIPPPA
jgi:hypothetical protein